MRSHTVFGLLMILGCITSSRGQLLNGDANFPVLHEIQWTSGMKDVRFLCESRHIVQSSTDSSMIINSPMLGFAALTEIQFAGDLKTIKLIQVKFNEATTALVDSITSHFIRIMGHQPIRTVKEKSLLIFTIRMEVASWKSRTGIVNLFASKRGESLFSASILMGAQTVGQTKANTK